MVIDFEELNKKIGFLKIGQKYLKGQLDRIEEKLDELKIQAEMNYVNLMEKLKKIESDIYNIN